MFLNEDYFDNIDITDDDLKTDSESGLYTDVNKDAKSLLKDMFSSYKQCLRFDFSTPFDEDTHSWNMFDKTNTWNLFDKTNKWDLFKNRIRKLCRVLDAYDIKYSESFFCTMNDWYDIRYKEININWNIIDIENNKVIVNTDNIDLYKNLDLTNGLIAFMFIDLPIFNSAKSAYRFLYRMANSLQNMIQIYNVHDAVAVFDISKDSQNWYIKDDDIKIYLNDLRIKAIMKPTILWIKDNILYLLSPQYKYRQEFKKMKIERELQDFIKNH